MSKRTRQNSERGISSQYRNGEYKVGYKKPPKNRQFKPGQSGNPAGKKRGAKSRATILRDVFDSKIWIVEDGKRKKITRFEALLRTISDGALKQRNIKYVELCLRLSGQFGAGNQRVAPVPPLRMIDETMTLQEAAKAYEETLAAIPGLIDPDFEIDFD